MIVLASILGILTTAASAYITIRINKRHKSKVGVEEAERVKARHYVDDLKILEDNLFLVKRAKLTQIQVVEKARKSKLWVDDWREVDVVCKTFDKVKNAAYKVFKYTQYKDLLKVIVCELSVLIRNRETKESVLLAKFDEIDIMMFSVLYTAGQ